MTTNKNKRRNTTCKTFRIVYHEDGIAYYLNRDDRDNPQLLTGIANATPFDDEETALEVADELGLTEDAMDKTGHYHKAMRPGYSIDSVEYAPKSTWYNGQKHLDLIALIKSSPVRYDTRQNRNAKEFDAWNASAPSACPRRGEKVHLLAESTRQVMHYRLGRMKKGLLDIGCAPATVNLLKSESAFDYSDAGKFRTILDAIYADATFHKNSRSRDRNQLQSSLNRYMLFLEARS
ncbi:hypothetical protein [Bifidobacterium leontopitheci]|uniref:Uncharacterized protein n=1 Tax=Bifidobacterium leontopitheci TaxID=2650774 RepID=A0A6I1GKZ1_9BIFI|nr:hypothetical protein [Bifidobacterium leontopitheci]KAB7790037.1 hypothetical protein F7D09_1455 [Bifidobacterium leontopitheci]